MSMLAVAKEFQVLEVEHFGRTCELCLCEDDVFLLCC